MPQYLRHVNERAVQPDRVLKKESNDQLKVLKFPNGLFRLPWWPCSKESCLLMQETCVRSLIQEDPTCRGATKPLFFSY